MCLVGKTHKQISSRPFSCFFKDDGNNPHQLRRMKKVVENFEGDNLAR